MADLERSLALVKAQFQQALKRASRRFKNDSLDIESPKILFPKTDLLKAALLFAVHRYWELLSAIGLPFFLTQEPYPLFHVHSSYLQRFPNLQNRELFLTFFYAALAETLELLLDETEGKNKGAVETILRPHLVLESIPALLSPHIGLQKLDEPKVIQMMDGIFTLKELQEMAKNLHQALAENLEAELRSMPNASQFHLLFKQIQDLGHEAKGQALWSIGKKELL